MYLYIMGRGHSGSTILDILLSSGRQIESVGQLFSGLRPTGHRKICSCGMAMPECAFWRQVRSRLEAEGIGWNEACAIVDTGLRGLWRVWRAGRIDPTMERRALITKSLARAIATITGKPHLVDSSKSPAHGLLLLRYLPEARIIHLIRDPRTMLQSYVWRVRSGSHLDPPQLSAARRNALLFLASAAADWIVVTLFCEMMARAYPDRVLRVRFEDLCEQPDVELGRIGRAFELDRADLADLAHKATSREPLLVGHGIGGNRLRRADTVRFDPAGAGRRELPLPRWLTIVSLLLCGPLMWRYGYQLRDGGPKPAPGPGLSR